MKIVIVAKRHDERTREVEEWLDLLGREAGLTAEWLDPEEIRGESFAVAHDIVQYPTIAVTTEGDGKMVQSWSGKLPQIEDVTYVLRDA